MNFQSSFSFWNEVYFFLISTILHWSMWRPSQSFITLLLKHCWHFLAWSCWHFNVYIDKFIAHEYIRIYECINMNTNWNLEAHLFYTLLFYLTMYILPIFLNISKEHGFNTHRISHYICSSIWGFHILGHFYCAHFFLFLNQLCN